MSCKNAQTAGYRRGALYATLDRLERKGLLRYKRLAGHALRDGLPRRY